MTLQAAITRATREMVGQGIDGSARDARILMAHALGIGTDRLTIERDRDLTAAEVARFDALVARRIAREPVSHILGRRSFYGRDFRVTADVLDPRPETETLIEVALSRPFSRVLDLGTGSGCILLSLLAEVPDATGIGVDNSQAACDVARSNAVRLGLVDRAEIRLGDWTAGIAGPFDLVVSNPPYIALAEMAGLAPEVRDWEPYGALTDGADGLMAYRAIAEAAPPVMAPGARLILEIGPTQGAAVRDLLEFVGFARIEVIPDLDGRDRVVLAHFPA